MKSILMQVYYETMFDGPWYENAGPSADKVRKDLIKKYVKGWHATDDYYKYIYINNVYDSHKIIEEEVTKGITENMQFGSWRGYATFGIEEAIIKSLNKFINRRIAIEILADKFKGSLNHYLYKPGGIRTRELKEDFESKKTKSSTSS